MSDRNYWTALRQRKISRRTMLGASAKAGVGVAGLALVGCGDDDEPDAGAVAAERAAAAAEEAAAAAVAAGEARAADSEAAAATAAGAADAAADAADAAGEASAAAADAADAAGEASAAASQAASAADAAAALAAEAAESEDAANAAAAAEAAAAAAADAAAAAGAAGDAAAAAVADAAAQAAEAAAQAARDAAAAVEAGTATAEAAQAAIDEAAEAAAAAAAAAGEASAAAGQAAATAAETAATAAETAATAEAVAEAAAETAAAAVAAAQEAADAAQAAAESAAMAAEEDEAVGHVPTGEVRLPVTHFSGTEAATSTSGDDNQMLWAIYDNLVSYDASLTPDPARSLAQSWEIPDELNVIFNLRENVQFHDGTPLSAEAVRLWVERGKTLEVSTIAGDLAAVGGVEETTDLTATFKMERPFSPLLWILGDRAGNILSPAVFDDFQEINSRSAPSGTGAFRFVEEEIESPFVVEANPNYWLPNAPSVERITWLQGATTAGNTNALLAGDLDMVWYPPAEDYGRIEDAGFNLQAEGNNAISFWNVNTNFEPWTNPHARHAFNAGVDQEEIVEVAYGGDSVPALWGWLGPTTIYHDPDERFWEFDPEVVQMHLNAGGFEDGFEFDVSVNAADLFATNQALFAQASLANFGITMNIEAKPSSDYWRGFMTSMDGSFFGGMSARADIWLQLAWNLIAGGVHDHALPPDKDPEVQDAFRKVEETFELEPRTEAMRELNRLAESRSYDIKTHYRTEAIAHDPGLQFEFFGDVKFHLGQDDIRWVT